MSELVFAAFEALGAGGVALDLYTEFVRPGWSPFPAPLVEEWMGTIP